jgi:farnesol dehydrogenase
MKHRFFITGATGLIGQALTLELASQGHQVHALIRSPQKAKAIEHPNVHLFQGDLTDPGSMARAMDGCSRVFHLAAYAKAWGR